MAASRWPRAGSQRLPGITRSVGLSVTIAFALLALLPAAAGAARRYPVESDLLWEWQAARMTPIWWVDSFNQDLMSFRSQDYAVIYDQRLSVASESWPFSPGTLKSATGLWGRGPERTAITYDRHDSAFLFRLRPRTETPVAAGQDISYPSGWDGSISQVEVADIDADSRDEAVVRLNTGFDLKPREIVALDWETGRRKWEFPVGPNPGALLLGDIDHDGRQEILFGSWAPGNGAVDSASGTDDLHCYVFCLGSDGRLRWKRPIGGYGKEASVAWLGHPGPHDRRILVCEHGTKLPGAEPDSLFVLDPQTGDLVEAGCCGLINLQSGVVTDQRGDPRIIVVGADDTLRLLDERLRPRGKRYVPQGCSRSFVLGHFTGDRTQQAALVCRSGSLLLFDASLRLLFADKEIAPGAGIQTVTAGNKTRLLVDIGGTGLHRFDLQEFWVLLPNLDLIETVLFALLMLMLSLLVFGYLRYRQDRTLRAVIRGLTGQAGVLEVRRNGRILRANTRARELLGRAEPGASRPDRIPNTGSLSPILELVKTVSADAESAAPREIVLPLGPGSTFLVRAIRTRSGVLVSLEDMPAVEYLRRVEAWLPVAQKLAHGIKNPLTTIALNLQQLEKSCGPDSRRYFDAAREEIARLTKMTRGFMSFTNFDPPRLEPCDLNEVLGRALDKFEGAKPAGIRVVRNLASDLPEVMIDREQVTAAFANVIENAFAAMGTQGTLTVTTTSARSGFPGEKPGVCVRLADTGVGIPERYRNRVFEPYFSLKPGGTGLGMAITRRIIEDHKGSIQIESTEGRGTTVTIVLPPAGTG